jgi:NAD(P)-dependent dehydrogenase (short-subunit alcohol dehydrogenase family)
MSSPFFQIFRVVFFLSVYHWGTLENAACGKFALRALAQSLAREYQPQGIHVAHIIVDGIISSARYPPQHHGIPDRKYFPEISDEAQFSSALIV